MTDEQPTHGGSYMRQPDGSLKRVDVPDLQVAPADAVAPPAIDAPKPTKSRRTKE